MQIIWKREAWQDYLYWQVTDRKKLKKINKLIQSIEREGYQCIGKPEPLKENKSGYWSVRIDRTNRIVFYIKDQSIIIIECRSHYGDK
ncbi:MAG: Txe/YoeB family addiction module toxin [Coriobacteriia bacterium]|nr:Txe/YoeB family addiction module toxin [Coriobacteriia bacterium]